MLNKLKNQYQKTLLSSLSVLYVSLVGFSFNKRWKGALKKSYGNKIYEISSFLDIFVVINVLDVNYGRFRYLLSSFKGVGL